jgi:hypothetical protein
MPVKGGSKKKTKSQPSQGDTAPSGQTAPAKPPVTAKKPHGVPSGKKSTRTKAAKVTDGPAGESEKEKTRWTEADDATMLQVFLSEKSEGNQSESGWKAGVYKRVADELNVSISSGGPKDPGSVRNRFSRVRGIFDNMCTTMLSTLHF